MSARRASARADQTTVRRVNLGVVLQHVAGDGPCSRARIAAETGLTRGTVSSLVAELIELELSARDRRGRAPGRRRAARADARAPRSRRRDRSRGQRRLPRRLHGGSRRATCASSAASMPTTGARRRARCSTASRELASEAIEECERTGLVVAGLAVAAARPDRGRHAARCSARRTSAGRMSQSPTSSVPGSGRLASASRTRRISPRSPSTGSERPAMCPSFICVFGEVGVGAGIVIDGELFRGAHGFGGEFGHMTVDPDGARLRLRQQRLPRDARRPGGDRAPGRCGARDAAGACAASPRSSCVAPSRATRPSSRASSKPATTLGVGLASAVNLLDVDAVVLGGCFGPLAPWLRDSVAATLGTRVLSARWTRCEVRASASRRGSRSARRRRTHAARASSPPRGLSVGTDFLCRKPSYERAAAHCSPCFATRGGPPLSDIAGARVPGGIEEQRRSAVALRRHQRDLTYARRAPS